MSWGKIDDQFHAHRKAKLAWKGHPRALGLHLLAISYSAGHLTDGLIDFEFVEEKLPVARERKQATDALVAAGLWIPADTGWRIHDWLDYNPSRADTLEKRRADAERKARRRAANSTRSPNGRAPDSARTPRGIRAVSAEPRAGAPAGVSRPDPTRPKSPPAPPEGGRHRDRVRWEKDIDSYAAEIFPQIPKNERDFAVRQAVKRGADSTEAVKAHIEKWFPQLALLEEVA